MPYIHPEIYGPRDELDPAAIRTILIRQAAIRSLVGLESRSLREVAKEIGCRHTAIDNLAARLAVRLGIRKVRASEQTRQRMRDARARALGALGQ